MKYREILIEQLKELPYFDKKVIYQLSEQYNLKKGTVDAYVNQSLAHQDLIQLKKGIYVSADYFAKNKGQISYIYYLANVLRQPSYVSSWTALQYYDLTTETIQTIISVTPKITRSYQNKTGNFRYHSIKNNLFSGFYLVEGKFDFFIASPAKALFDLIYFKTNQLKGMRLAEIEGLVKELRIDIDEMDSKERNNFSVIIKDHLE
ncbi:MAG: hypothetical protein HQ530_04460 [Parcubacteria group bacterium]|nr:hypothetical protein [Parcubacteria group bacterium]